jgi:hypothetical protein
MPPSIPVTPVKPVQNDKPAAASAADQDGDNDGSGGKVSAAKPAGMGGLVDIQA